MTEASDKLDRAQAAQAGQLARSEDVGETIFEAVRRNEGGFAAALPSRIDAEHFLRGAMTELRLKPDLQTCSTASLLGALMLSAQVGLVPGPLGHVYLVPYGSKATRGREVQFQIGYKGFIVLADRAGFAITGHTIREGDAFDFQLGDGAYVIHKPKIRGAGDAYAWWVKAERGPFAHIEVLNRDQVENYRARSQAGRGGPWNSDYDAMALKTVVRRVMKLLPIDTAQAADADVAAGYAADGGRATYQPATHELTVAPSEDFDTYDEEPEPDADPEP